jgi:hypothetical protein
MTDHATVNRAQWTSPQVKKIEAGSAEDGDGSNADGALAS